jgi:hypothetical protein
MTCFLQACYKMGPATTAATTITVPGPQLGADMFCAAGDTFAAGLLSGLGPVFVGSLMKSAGAGGSGAFLRGMGPHCKYCWTSSWCHGRAGWESWASTATLCQQHMLCTRLKGVNSCGLKIYGFQTTAMITDDCPRRFQQ